jgi:hypothetical protein
VMVMQWSVGSQWAMKVAVVCVCFALQRHVCEIDTTTIYLLISLLIFSALDSVVAPASLRGLICLYPNQASPMTASSTTLNK